MTKKPKTIKELRNKADQTMKFLQPCSDKELTILSNRTNPKVVNIALCDKQSPNTIPHCDIVQKNITKNKAVQYLDSIIDGIGIRTTCDLMESVKKSNKPVK